LIDYIDPRFTADAASVAAAGGTLHTDGNGHQYIVWDVTVVPQDMYASGNLIPAGTTPSVVRSFEITAKDDYLGDNYEWANGSSTGLYNSEGTQCLVPIPQPEVNVPIDIEGFSVTENLLLGMPRQYNDDDSVVEQMLYPYDTENDDYRYPDDYVDSQWVGTPPPTDVPTANSVHVMNVTITPDETQGNPPSTNQGVYNPETIPLTGLNYIINVFAPTFASGSPTVFLGESLGIAYTNDELAALVMPHSPNTTLFPETGLIWTTYASNIHYYVGSTPLADFLETYVPTDADNDGKETLTVSAYYGNTTGILLSGNLVPHSLQNLARR
jgi:hypothetical protein